MVEVSSFPHPLVILLAFLFLFLVPTVKLLRRTGHHAAWSIFALFPGLNLVAFWYFAFKPWPTITDNRRRPAGDIPVQLPDAELEEIESQQEAGRADAEHEARMKFLTGPGTGIRPFVSREIRRKRCAQTFTVGMLASALSATHSEVEEALSILKSRGLAIETSEPGHWDIRT